MPQASGPVFSEVGGYVGIAFPSSAGIDAENVVHFTEKGCNKLLPGDTYTCQ